MQHSDFKIGTEFKMADARYRCTDVGTRIIVAIRIDKVIVGSIEDTLRGSKTTELGHADAARQGWFNGPPYAVTEHVIDEDDLPACTLWP